MRRRRRRKSPKLDHAKKNIMATATKDRRSRAQRTQRTKRSSSVALARTSCLSDIVSGSISGACVRRQQILLHHLVRSSPFSAGGRTHLVLLLSLVLTGANMNMRRSWSAGLRTAAPGRNSLTSRRSWRLERRPCMLSSHAGRWVCMTRQAGWLRVIAGRSMHAWPTLFLHVCMHASVSRAGEVRHCMHGWTWRRRESGAFLLLC